jgi:hypothetical protein
MMQKARRQLLWYLTIHPILMRCIKSDSSTET